MNEMKALKPIDFDKEITHTQDEIRNWIACFEAELLKLPQVEIEVAHHFSKDVYAREMPMKKGELVIGKIHKHQNLNILSQGEVTVLSVDGVKRIKAPCTFVASPGAKRVIYAHEDSRWTVIHGTPETDLEKIENEFIAKSYDEVEALDHKEAKEIEGALCLG